MISKEKMDFAVKQVVDNCLKAKKGEKACVITDNQTKHIGLAIAEKLKQATGNVNVFVMEDFGSRPEDGSNPLKFPKEIEETLKSADVSVFAAQGKKGELPTFRSPMLKVVNSNEKLRHAHMIGISSEIMAMGVSSDYNSVQMISKQVFALVSKAKRIKVTTKKGTDFTAEFSPNLKWLVDDGDIKPGALANLPAGEVFTCPKNVEGRVVVDGVLGDYFEEVGILDKTPIIMDISEGRVTKVECSNKKLEKEILEYLSQEDNANRIGEFAIGTNIGLTKLIGNLLQDEKFPSIHIAVGHPFPNETGADWDSESHLDMVIQKTTVDVDGKVIMKDGKFI